MGVTTDYERARAEYLRELALDPGSALDAWRRLVPAEQAAVVMQMGMFYDRGFASTFHSLASRGLRPNAEVVITNSPRVQHSPPALKAAGYALKSGSTTTQYWVHPSGRQVWLIPNPKGMPPASLDVGKDEPESSPEELIAESERLLKRANELPEVAARLKRNRVARNWDAREYYRSRKLWWDDYRAWKGDLDELLAQTSGAGLRLFSRGQFETVQRNIAQLSKAAERPPSDLLEPLEAVEPK